MKISAVLFLLIVSSCYVVECTVSRSINTPETMQMSVDEQLHMIVIYNKFRQLFADLSQIGNMHGLVYNSELEQTARKVGTCQQQNHGTNYRIIFFPEDEYKKKSKIFENYQKNKKSITDPQGLKDGILSDPIASEFLNPLQTRIGCAYFIEKCPMMLKATFFSGNEFPKGVCALGPLGTGYENGKPGPPGSQCPGEKNSYGSCKEVKVTKISNMAGWSTTILSVLWFSLLMSL